MGNNAIHQSSLGRKHWRPYVQLRKHRRYSPDRAPVAGEHIENAWHHVPAPQNLNEWAQDEALARLSQICAWVGSQLNNPTKLHRVSNNGVHHFLRVLESIVIVFDYVTAQIRLYHYFNKKLQPYISPKQFKSGTLMPASAWAAAIVKNTTPQTGSIFLTKEEEDQIRRWLENIVMRMLLRDPRFQKLIQHTLPQLIKLPHERYSMAMAARPNPNGPILHLREYNIVWQREQQFRQVARENPQLLPLVMALCLKQSCLPTDCDMVHYLRSMMLAQGLTPAAWRYVTRHGSRLFKTVWVISPTPASYFDAAVSYLKALDCAGLPPPPPPYIANIWLHAYCDHMGNSVAISSHFFESTPARVLRTALLEAERHRHGATLPQFAEDFLAVLRWSEDIPPENLESNQLKAGWQWLLRRARANDQVQAILAHSGNQNWGSRLPAQFINGWDVVPITSNAELKLEAMAMRNCLAQYEEDCAEGKLEIYSLRDPATGKRKGCFGFTCGDPIVAMFDAKGYANTPLPPRMEAVGYAIWEKLVDRANQVQTVPTPIA